MLDARYPRLQAPEETLTEDLHNDSRDLVCQSDPKLASEIHFNANRYGRLRHPTVDGKLHINMNQLHAKELIISQIVQEPDKL